MLIPTIKQVSKLLFKSFKYAILLLVPAATQAVGYHSSELLKIADSLSRVNQLDSACQVYKECFASADEARDSLNVILAFKGLCNSHRLNRDQNSVAGFKRDFEKYRSADYHEDLIRAEIVYGMLCFNQGKLKESIKIYDSVYNVMAQDLKDGYVGASLLSAKGDSHNELGEYDSALSLYEMAMTIYSNIGLTSHVSRVRSHIGIIYKNKGDCKKAISIYNEVKPSVLATGDTSRIMTLYNNMANCFKDIDEFDSSKKYFQLGLDLSRKVNLKGEENILLQNLTTSLEDKSALLEQTVENRSLQRNIMILVAGLILVLAVGALIVFRGRLKRQRLIQEQEKLLHQQRVNELMKEQEIASINAEMDGMREERDRVAKDLHDRLGGMMGALRIQFDHVAENIQAENPELKEKMVKATSMLNESVGEIRKVAHNMASAAISEFGFEKAVAKLVERIAGSSSLKINFIASGHDFQFKSGVEMELYKIIQELISNILKHANAHDVHIESSVSEGEFQLMVEDDGVGFNVPESSKGLGINSVKQRVDKLNGKLIYDSSPGNGTTVIVEVPI